MLGLVCKTTLSALGLAAFVVGVGAISVRLAEKLTPSLRISTPYTRLFCSGLIGLLGAALTRAALVTEGRTILLGWCLLAPCALYALSKGEGPSIAQSEPLRPTHFVFLALAALVPVLYVLYRQLDLSGGGLLPPHPDHSFYATMVAAMDASGVETNRGLQTVFRPDQNGVAPYHYLDLWLASLGYRLTGLTYLQSYTFLVPSLCAFVLVLGFFSLLEQVTSPSTFGLLTVVAFILFSPTWLPVFAETGLLRETRTFWAFGSFLGTHVSPKTLTVELFLVAFAVALPKRGAVAATILLAGAFFASIAAIGILLAVALIIPIGRSPRRRWFDFWPLLIACSLAIPYFVWFYSNQASPSSTASFNLSLADVVRAFFSHEGLVVRSHIVVKSLMQISIIYSVAILLVVLSMRKNRPSVSMAQWRVILGLAVVFFAGLLTSLVAHPMSADDSSQFFTIVGMGAMNVVLGLAVIRALSARPSASFPSVSLGGFFAVNAIFLPRVAGLEPARSREYVQAVLASPPKSPIGAFVRDAGDFNARTRKMNLLFPAGGAFLHSRRFWGAISIADMSRPSAQDTPQMRQLAEQGIFRRFYREQKILDPDISVPLAQLAFVRSNNIDWLVVDPKSHIPDSIVPFVETEIRDPLSGERYVRLRFD